MGRKPRLFKRTGQEQILRNMIAEHQLKDGAAKGEEETELEWMSRMRKVGFTDERIHEFQKVRSHDQFVEYCTFNQIGLPEL